LEKNDNFIVSKKIDFEIKTKEELSDYLLYLRTRMKLELNKIIPEWDSLYSEQLLEKQVCHI